jgi:hypothetical protein
MIVRRDPEGNMGFMVKKGGAAREWYRYFVGMRLHNKAAHLKSAMLQDRAYMVPCEWPEQYDPDFTPSKDRYRIEQEATKDEREAIVEKFNTILSGIGKHGDIFQQERAATPVGHIYRVSDRVKAEREARNGVRAKSGLPYRDD